MKREESLQPFSRDHHNGLVVAKALLDAVGEDAAARQEALGQFSWAWQTEMAAHFADEERLLIPLLDAHAGRRLTDEHRMLRELANEALLRRQRRDPDAAFLKRLGTQLHDHIRWEERELFPALEAALTDEQAAALGAETAAFEATRPRSQPGTGGISRGGGMTPPPAPSP